MTRARLVPALKRPRPQAQRLLDAALGAAIAALMLVGGATGVGPTGPASTIGPDAVGLVGAVGLAGAVAIVMSVRRILPFTVLLAMNAITAMWYLLDYPGRFVTLAALIACYTVPAQRGWRWGAAGWLATAAATTAVVHGTLEGSEWFDDRAVNALALEFAAVALGAAVHYYRAVVAETREHVERIADARAGQAMLRSAEQRLAISRELHDVVGHTLATISVQAGVALHVMDRQPEQAAQALTTIKTLSDEGLAEVQVLLGVLRVQGSSAESPAVGDGLKRIDALLKVTRATGTPVEFTVRGTPTPLPPQVDLAAFRILQESLTNARRHARAPAVSAQLAYNDTTLEIVVRNNGVASEHANSPAGGTGIAGMQARATALGGTLTTSADGGFFEVRAVLPLEVPS